MRRQHPAPGGVDSLILLDLLQQPLQPDLAAAGQPEGARDLAAAGIAAGGTLGLDEVQDRLTARLRHGR